MQTNLKWLDIVLEPGIRESMCICVRKITRHLISTQMRQSYSCKSLFVIADSLLILAHLFFKHRCQQHHAGLFGETVKKKKGQTQCRNILVAYSERFWWPGIPNVSCRNRHIYKDNCVIYSVSKADRLVESIVGNATIYFEHLWE